MEGFDTEKELSLLQVKGEEIVDASGRPVRLRGVCIGGWLNMENFINGYPGVESSFRRAVQEALGEDKARFFFTKMLDNFIADVDLRYIASLGSTVVRVAINYRHLEDDMNPFNYKGEGFHYLDKLADWCRSNGLYVILDMHAAPGWQNPDWHSDNPNHCVHLWEEKLYQDRLVGLWEAIARHYKDEPVIAGYNVLNEPVCRNPKDLNQVYRRVTKAIRKVDADHILFLEGNFYSTYFDELDPPFDANTVYSCHSYVPPGLSKGVYPGVIGRVQYDFAKLEENYKHLSSFMQRHRVPNWVGEFGSKYWGTRYDRYRLKVVDDIITIFEKYKDHWTIWTYKDIGVMGLVYVRQDSEWMKRTQKVRLIKKRIGCDFWTAKDSQLMQRLRQGVIKSLKQEIKDHKLPYQEFENKLNKTLGGILFSEFILPLYAAQFKGMSNDEIERMMKSFRWENCIRRKGLEKIIRKHCQGDTK